MNINFIYMRSFFDDTLPQTSFWEKQSLKVEEKNLEYQSILFEKSKKTGFWVSRNYIIYESKLVKLKVSNSIEVDKFETESFRKFKQGIDREDKI